MATGERIMKLQDVENTLNELLFADPEATDDLIHVGVHVNDNVVDHPTIICWSRSEKACYSIRILGILNGMIAKSHPKRRIAAVYEDDNGENGKLTGFKIVSTEELERGYIP